jgi:hypothetical protein
MTPFYGGPDERRISRLAGQVVLLRFHLFGSGVYQDWA